MTIVIATETWNTRKGQIIKAVARDSQGHLLGATNQTKAVAPVLVGRK